MLTRHGAMHYNCAMALEDYITTSDACELLGEFAVDGERLDRSTFTRWVQLGKIKPADRLSGGRHGIFLFRRADVEALRDQMRREKAEASA